MGKPSTYSCHVPMDKEKSSFVQHVMKIIITSIVIGERSQDEFQDDLNAIYKCICNEYHWGMGIMDTIAYVKCLEHFDPKLAEDVANERMQKIRSKYVQ